VRLAAIYGRGGGIPYMVFVAPEADFDRLWPVFEKVMFSLRLR
jgi:hypothetical protein